MLKGEIKHKKSEALKILYKETRIGRRSHNDDDDDDELELLAISARTGNHHCNRSYQHNS